MFSLASVGTVLDDVRGDIRDYDSSKVSMTAICAPEVQSSSGGHSRSFAARTPIPWVHTPRTVMGTVHLMEAIRKTPSVRAVICVTTDKCYQNQAWIWPYRESDPLGGYDPYGRQARRAPKIVSALPQLIPFQSSECMNTIGRGDCRAGNSLAEGDWSEGQTDPNLVAGSDPGQPVLSGAPTPSVLGNTCSTPCTAI